MLASNSTEADESTPTVPAAIESARAKLVYLALETGGPATVDELATHLDETRLALLSVLGALEDRGLVARRADGYAPV
jgi:predicted transcriptional regulator